METKDRVEREAGRTRHITVRLTEEEDALVTAGARLRGISKSDYLRETLRQSVVAAFARSGKMGTR